MISRICPQCKFEWFSADEVGTWECSSCGALIPPHKDTDLDDKKEVKTCEQAH